jgi:hypothetical protein
LSKLPESICFDVNHANLTLLEQVIGNHLVVKHSHAKADKYELQTVLEKMEKLPAFTITSKVQSDAEDEKVNSTSYFLIQL